MAVLKWIVIALVIYLVVVTRSKIRLPHPGMQAAADLLTAADLSDAEVISMARAYVGYADGKHVVATAQDPHAVRLQRLTDRYEAVNGVRLNFKAYCAETVNAFATADGSIRLYTGLMDALQDDELMAIVGHELGHVRYADTLSAMRKAYVASAARGLLGAAGGALGQLSASQLGGLAQQYATAQFSQKQEFRADDFAFGFLVRNGYDPRAMAHALEKIGALAPPRESALPEGVMQLFSTHPQTEQRIRRMRARAQAHAKV